MARKKAKAHRAPPEIGGPDAFAAVPAAVGPARQQPVMLKEPPKPSARLAEVAGGTAAGCAAVCCCCPCGLVNLLVLTVVRLPAGLCHRALKTRAKRRAANKRRKAGLLGPNPASGAVEEEEDDEEGLGLHGAVLTVAVAREAWPAKPPPEEVMEMEKEMWAKFYSAGFWRSPSQREAEEERRDRNSNGIGDGQSPPLSPFPRSDSPR
ncbi:putative Pollen preferential protein [Cocos nucifera]|nr:putative Pollen preferential protein [Cocos nucifera]